MKYPCKGILRTKQTLVSNEAMVPLEQTHPQIQKPTGHLDVVLKTDMNDIADSTILTLREQVSR
jgi:hypothetical protein